LNIELANTRTETSYTPVARRHIRPAATPSALSRRYPSTEMRRQAQIAYTAALEVLG